LIDTVVVKKAGATVIQWQFATGDTIVNEATGDAPTAGKWARSNYGYTVSKSASASDTFLVRREPWRWLVEERRPLHRRR